MITLPTILPVEGTTRRPIVFENPYMLLSNALLLSRCHYQELLATPYALHIWEK